jgi:uncharacterized small protein (DUF1192 family)
MKRYEVHEGSDTSHCCFQATVFDTLTGNSCECLDAEEAREICDALNANEEYKSEISRLKAELKRWMDARENALACEKLTLDELDMLRSELKIARDEIERLRAKMDL